MVPESLADLPQLVEMGRVARPRALLPMWEKHDFLDIVTARAKLSVQNLIYRVVSP
jgi:hypothetical protein